MAWRSYGSILHENFGRKLEIFASINDMRFRCIQAMKVARVRIESHAIFPPRKKKVYIRILLLNRLSLVFRLFPGRVCLERLKFRCERLPKFWHGGSGRMSTDRVFQVLCRKRLNINWCMHVCVLLYRAFESKSS